MNAKALPTNVTAYGYRWFERTNGNTYHTVIVFVDHVEIFRSEKMSYGYGSQWEQTAFDAYLRITGTTTDIHTPRRYFDSVGVTWASEVFDVPRKRDLFNFAPFYRGA